MANRKKTKFPNTPTQLSKEYKKLLNEKRKQLRALLLVLKKLEEEAKSLQRLMNFAKEMGD